jgi:hypothetical protein
MTINNQNINPHIDLLKLPSNVLDMLVKKLKTLLYSGDLYAIKDKDGGAIIYYNTTKLEEEKIGDIDLKDNSKYFRALLSFVQVLSMHNGEEISAENLGLSKDFDSNVHHLWNRFVQEGIINDFLYAFNTIGNRIVPTTIRSGTKFLTLARSHNTNLYPCVDIIFQTNFKGAMNEYLFEIGILDLSLFIEKLTEIQKELKPINSSVSKDNI